MRQVERILPENKNPKSFLRKERHSEILLSPITGLIQKAAFENNETDALPDILSISPAQSDEQ